LHTGAHAAGKGSTEDVAEKTKKQQINNADDNNNTTMDNGNKSAPWQV